MDELKALSDKKLPSEIREAEANTAEMLASPGMHRDIARAVRGGALDQALASRQASAEAAARTEAAIAEKAADEKRAGTMFDGTVPDEAGRPRRGRFKQGQSVEIKGDAKDPERGASYSDAHGTIHGTPYFDAKAGEMRYPMVVEDGSLGVVKESQLREPAPRGRAFFGGLHGVSQEAWDAIFGKKQTSGAAGDAGAAG